MTSMITTSISVVSIQSIAGADHVMICNSVGEPMISITIDTEKAEITLDSTQLLVHMIDDTTPDRYTIKAKIE